MNHIANIKHYNGLLRDALTGGATIKNIYMFPQEIEYYIARSMLYYEIYDDGVAFFCDKELYCRLYFCFKANGKIEFPEFNKPLITEIISNSAVFSPVLHFTERLVESFGFKINNYTSRMAMTTETNEICEWKNKYNKKTEIIYANINLIDDIYSLWLNTFDPVKNLLPSKKELFEDIENGSIIVAVLNDTLCGTLKFEFTKTSGYIWHEAVSPEIRGIGIGTMLTSVYLETAAAKKIFRHYLWVEDGSPAVEFHKKFKYKFDGRFSRQYIKN